MAEPESNRLKLMVVDDEADNLDLLYRTFRRDFDVLKADSGPKALQLLEQHGEMAVIISDQRMPRMNGTEFLSRTVERFPDTLRILLTGYTDVEDLVGAINAGKVFKYITKPWNPKDLRTIVMQAADTYRIVKQRTNELHRALRRESIFNAVTTAVRESLDYHSMLQTVVRTIGQTFAADGCLLRPVERLNGSPQCQFASEAFTYAATNTADPTAIDAPFRESALDDSKPLDPIGSSAAALGVPEPDLALLMTLTQTCQSQLLSIVEPSPYTQLIVPLICQQEPVAVLVLHKQGSAVWAEEEIRLIESVAEQAALAISQAKLYQRIQAQTEQMRAELAVARQIQTNLLRQTFPDLETVKIQAYCFPAREIGGDFFEIYVHPQGDIWLAVGDVSGKGVPAALFMASAISLLRRELAQEISPAPNIVMQNLNHSLSDNLVNSNCFITLILARYTPTTRDLVYANAGHIYPLVWSQRQLEKERQTVEVVSVEPTYLKTRGVPLGILPVWKAAAGQLTLQSGDVLLLTSDGITEAALESSTQARTMLHQAGLWHLISQQRGSLNLKDLLSVIQMKTQVQEDDQTILSLEVL
ncbi:SpoIIE family protein phosphatase [Leptolyngbya sp. NK1-12]|uniref:SpoIIE family protein phosphatase n=1 Tax=Leptolyngbya sp. NK1-12 TaxID=2547451 RepID=A0AA96WNY7_9CYAN|nr:SpoIIE family protein phosphatase [Leptolyngbya sp. NK1-12]